MTWAVSAALWADLDTEEAAPHLKAQGIPTWALAWELIGDLSEILGTRPLHVTMTGHGLQPVWGLSLRSQPTWYS